MTEFIGPAVVLRAYEILKGAPFTESELGNYLRSYSGKKPKSLVEGSYGFLLFCRHQAKSGAFFKRGQYKRILQIIESGADDVLSNRELRSDMQDNIRSEFRGVLSLNKDSPSLGELVSDIIIETARVNPFGSIANLGDLQGEIGVYFERACYCTLRLDMLLFQRHSESRNAIAYVLHNRIDAVFSELTHLRCDEVRRLLNDRIDSYGELVREKGDISDLHALLATGIGSTVRNKGIPMVGGLDDFSLNVDAIDDFELRMRLVEWEKGAIMSALKLIDSEMEEG